jgi:predicted metalloprotease with PDZ domain
VISRTRFIVAVVVLCVAGLCAQQMQAPAPTVGYSISLADVSTHLLHVKMQIPAGADERTVRLPVWNALYQVRDFAQYVEAISVADPNGARLPIDQTETSAWQISGAKNGAVVSYDLYADNPGPYGAQVNDHHAFLNLAELLMYESGEARKFASSVTFNDIPQEWTLASALAPSDGAPDHGKAVGFTARTYDQLVDTPVEIGNSHKITFQDGGTKYLIVVDADPADYDAAAIESSVRRIAHTEVEWMKDQPCPKYVFIFHFPHGQGGGGMEHACSTAIDVQAERMDGGDMSAFDSVTAHEFFHLWNVKRIRPQSLEPIDYTKEQYTRALWFSEGVTSTVEEIVLLRAGLITREEYLRRLSGEIDTLQQRPAHKTQSVEESSLDAWFEKYPFYRHADRSISYYNKGEILGVMLDLAIREASGGTKSLRDMFLWMNENDARKQKFFADSEGVRTAVEAVTGRDFSTFFREYVAGTTEIPYDQFLRTVGLRVNEERRTVVDAGFTLSRNFDALPTVLAVQSGSEAERAGVKVGDAVVSVENKGSNLMNAMATMGPGDLLHLQLRARGQDRDVQFKLGSREISHFAIMDVEHPTAEQMNRRAEWLCVNAPSLEGEGCGTPRGAARQ